MKDLKKRAAFALVCALTLSVAGCGQKTAADNGEISQSVSDKDGGSEQQSTTDKDSTDETENTAEADSSEESTRTEDASDIVEDGSEASSDTALDASSDSEDEDSIMIPDDIMTTRRDIPDTEGLVFAENLKAGWNLGNTFDAYDDSVGKGDNLSTETCWQPDKTTPELMKTIHEAGFESIRIPVSWHNHFIDDDYTISEAWMDRVEEVVNMALDEGLYVIINIHHDNNPSVGCLYPDEEHREQSMKFVKRVWSQVGERFKDASDRLVFESLNEPRLVGTSEEWDYQDSNAKCKEAAAIINDLNQCFVDTIRAQGGGNSDRWLTCPAYCASVNAAISKSFVLPSDPAGRVMVSTHAYTPYDFALNLSGTDWFNYRNKSHTKELDSIITKLYITFISKGIPVIMDEFGALKKNDNLQSRVDFTAYYVAQARASGITCFLWDNNSYSGTGENFGIIRRGSCEWEYPEIAEAMVRYSVID